MSILQFFPASLTPRPQQAKLLLDIEAAWDTHDCHVITAPTATGKTELAYTIANWSAARGQAASILEPDNMLVDQTVARYPALTVLHRKELYPCLNTGHEPGCDCVHKRALKAVRTASVRVMNYWIYLYNRLHSPVAIFDEGHRIVDMLRGMQEVKLWQSLYKFETGLHTVGQFVAWAQEHVAAHPKDDKLIEVIQKVSLVHPSTEITYHRRRRGKKADILLSVEPTTVAYTAQQLWPAKVRKIVLMSATIGPQDVKELGLDSRRVVYFECGSPIPASQRPFVYRPTYNVSRNCVEKALPTVAQAINDLLAAHPEKGLLHFPYALAAQLRPLLSDPRLLFHTKKDKAAVLTAFRDSPPSEGKVLVASGLYEGLDLPYDAARWQLIGKVPYLSLADPWIASKTERDPDWYAWNAVKRVLQAYGRVVRAPDDYGETIIMDTAFERLWRESKAQFPSFFKDALKEEKNRWQERLKK